jgi:hypothetical protein
MLFGQVSIAPDAEFLEIAITAPLLVNCTCSHGA